jgi:hypothetical protein
LADNSRKGGGDFSQGGNFGAGRFCGVGIESILRASASLRFKILRVELNPYSSVLIRG